MDAEVTLDPPGSYEEAFDELYELLMLYDEALPGAWERLVSTLEVFELVVFELFERPELDYQMLRALAVVWQRCDRRFRLRLAQNCIEQLEQDLRARLRVGRAPSLETRVRVRGLVGWLDSSLGRPLFCAQA